MRPLSFQDLSSVKGGICRHRPGDPACGQSGRDADAAHLAEMERAYRQRMKALDDSIPDAARFDVIEAEQIGAHLVLNVRYPNCAACAYEGSKVLVYLQTTLKDAIRWRKIDPHFRDPGAKVEPGEAPSPAARFPASSEGWVDAVAYATSKGRQ